METAVAMGVALMLVLTDIMGKLVIRCVLTIARQKDVINIFHIVTSAKLVGMDYVAQNSVHLIAVAIRVTKLLAHVQAV